MMATTTNYSDQHDGGHHDNHDDQFDFSLPSPPTAAHDRMMMGDGLVKNNNSNSNSNHAPPAPPPPIATNNVVMDGPPDSYCTSITKCLSCLYRTYKVFNHFAVTILIGFVIFLFIQVQYLNHTVATQQTELHDLEAKLQNQTTTQIQQLSQKVDQEQNLTLYQMAGTFTLLASLLTMFHMSSHLRHFYQPIIQRKIVAILWLSPIYAVTSFFSLVFPSADGYLAVIKDFYEAYAIFVFLSFLISVLGKGDRNVAVEALSHHTEHLKKPTRCLRGCYHPQPETSPVALANAVLTECQILCMQFVFVRPLTSIAKFVTETLMEDLVHTRQENEIASGNSNAFATQALDLLKSPMFYISMITNVSVFLAFTGLLKFYHAVREDLQWMQPFSKFMTIKGIVFLTFWQGVLISIIVQVMNKKSNSSNPSSYGIVTTSGGTSTVITATAASTQAPISPTTNTAGDDIIQTFASTTPPPMSAATPAPDDMMTSNNTTGGGRYDFRFLQGENNNEDIFAPINDVDPKELAAQIQNFLICLEMLFFSIAHWCVFPAEEWEPDYRPRHYAKPGIGLSDFVNDMSYIIASRSEARKERRENAAAVLSAANSTDEDDNDLEHAGDDDNNSKVASKTRSESYSSNENENVNDGNYDDKLYHDTSFSIDDDDEEGTREKYDIHNSNSLLDDDDGVDGNSNREEKKRVSFRHAIGRALLKRKGYRDTPTTSPLDDDDDNHESSLSSGDDPNRHPDTVLSSPTRPAASQDYIDAASHAIHTTTTTTTTRDPPASTPTLPSDDYDII